MLKKAGKLERVSLGHNVVKLRYVLPQFHIQPPVRHAQCAQPLGVLLVQLVPATRQTRRLRPLQLRTRQPLTQLHRTLASATSLCSRLHQRRTSFRLRPCPCAFSFPSQLLPPVVFLSERANVGIKVVAAALP